ncbi:MAG TPA: hypothetical protein VK617_13130 [Gemmatimonadaceae bacterium]|nr:hypothetical protein [Gemmatimonadaceae bacterium]
MSEDLLTSSPRRSFLGRLAAGSAALGLTAFLPVTACAAEKTVASASDSSSAEPSEWPGTLKTKHKMVIDAFAMNEGFPLAFAYTFMLPYASVTPSPATAVVVLRHEGFPIALNDAVWAKYKIGKAMNIIDPTTKAPAERNPFFNAKPGSLPIDDMAVDKLMAKGTILGACNVALHFMSAKFAGAAGVTPDIALKDWTAGIIPGITIIPSGTWGVNRSQELGCSYCAGA